MQPHGHVVIDVGLLMRRDGVLHSLGIDQSGYEESRPLLPQQACNSSL